MKGAKILVVEDDTTIQTYLKKKLELFGYYITDMVTSGEEAIQKVTELTPDLVIMDIGLEGKMDGVQAASVIRYRYDIPVVFLTANSDDETLLRVKDADPFGFIVKPIVEKDFYMTIELALFKYHQEKQLRNNEEKYLEILNLAPCAFIALDQQDSIIFINKEAEQLLNLDFISIKGLNFFETFNLNPDCLTTETVCNLTYRSNEPVKVKIRTSDQESKKLINVLVLQPEK